MLTSCCTLLCTAAMSPGYLRLGKDRLPSHGAKLLIVCRCVHCCTHGRGDLVAHPCAHATSSQSWSAVLQQLHCSVELLLLSSAHSWAFKRQQALLQVSHTATALISQDRSHLADPRFAAGPQRSSVLFTCTLCAAAACLSWGPAFG